MWLVSSSIENVTKFDVARREINAAIRMYFHNEDPIAVHALAAGGMQIVIDLGKNKGLKLGIEAGDMVKVSLAVEES